MIVNFGTAIKLQVGMFGYPSLKGTSGLALKIKISKNGDRWRSIRPKIDDVGHIKKGLYFIHLRPSYLDTEGELSFHITAKGGLDTMFTVQVCKPAKKEWYYGIKSRKK